MWVIYFFSLVVLVLFWLLRQIRASLFWLYLWQLKEYHLGRFLDHFRTEKGKELFLNPLFLTKIILLFFIKLDYFFAWFLFFFYILESIKFFKEIRFNNFKRPVLTSKTILLIISTFFFIILFLYFLSFNGIFSGYSILCLLLFDILTPIIISIIVFFIHSITVLFFRNRIIKQATEKRKKFSKILTIAITGSYGKTSTKEFLANILSEKYRVLSTEKHQNSETGVSQCILEKLNSSYDIFIAEMATYNKNGIKLISDIVKPQIGIITGINEQHLSIFGSMENLISAEGGKELIESLPKDGIAILNGNNKIIQEKENEIKRYNLNLKKIIFCSLNNKENLWVDDIILDKEFVNFKIFSKEGDSAEFKVNLLGVQNIENILMAVCCAKELGMNLKDISNACQKFKTLPNQMELKKKNNINIIDSTYSSNPSGVIAHLEYLKSWKGKKVIIMPCLIELGKTSKDIHEKIGEKIAEVCDLVIITTKERFEDIKKGAVLGGMDENNILFLADAKIIKNKIKPYLNNDNVILLEGRSSKQIVDLFKKI